MYRVLFLLGLILYNGHKRNEPGNDFIALSLNGGVPEFRFNLGHNATLLTADRALMLGKWHTIKVIRNRKKGIFVLCMAKPACIFSFCYSDNVCGQ